MTPDSTELAAALPWYRSPVFVSLLVSLVMQALSVLHVANSVAEADVAKLIDMTLQIAAIAVAGIAAWKRKSAAQQPLKLTQASADAHIAKQSDETTEGVGT